MGPLACNCYVIGDPQTREVIVVDPGGEAAELATLLATNELKAVAIVEERRSNPFVAEGSLSGPLG